MSEVETVEVTLKIPQPLKDFLEAAIRALICISTGHMDIEECDRFEKKYGHDISTIYLPESLEP